MTNMKPAVKSIAEFIFFKIWGWQLNGSFPHLDKCVVIVVPHTSWVDFLLGLLVRRVIQKDINFIAKKSLFKFPFGWYFRWMGGTPIDRSKSSNAVLAIVDIFNQHQTFRLALSPEGTRKKVTQWKTGFYYIAKAAKVPIVMAAFDYGKRQIKFSEPQYPTDDIELDFKNYKIFFKGVLGKVPDYSFDS